MPHSSGGGSSGGGFHGGSHGRSSVQIHRHHFVGSTRYRYHYRGQTDYFYSNTPPKKLFSWWRLLFALLYLPFLIIIPWMEIETDILPYFKEYPPSVLILDDAHILTEPDVLKTALTEFYEKTGIPAAVVTVPSARWEGLYPSLEDYAYRRYLYEFNDEMHWLIVYSEPEHPDPANPVWYWEGMQGNYTDPVLTEAVTDCFNAELHARLKDPAEGLERDLAYAFGMAASSAKRRTIFSPIKGILLILFTVALIVFYAYYSMGLNYFRYRNAESAPEE